MGAAPAGAGAGPAAGAASGIACGPVYATACKRREEGRVVEVIRAVVFGMACLPDCWLGRSGVSDATDRHQNARGHRKTYCFSKSKRMQDATTCFVSFCYNLCWEVRTPGVKEEGGPWRGRTPAMAAGLADHVWSLEEWLRYPAKPRLPV